jgi:hypothetical protein
LFDVSILTRNRVRTNKLRIRIQEAQKDFRIRNTLISVVFLFLDVLHAKQQVFNAEFVLSAIMTCQMDFDISR